MKKKIILLFLTFLLFACGREGSTVKEWSLSLDNSEDSVTYILAEKFKQELEMKSQGSIHLNLFPNAVLGGDRESIESCQMGEITFVVQNTAPQVNFIPEVAIFDMFNIFPDIQTARRVLDSDFLSKIQPYYCEKRLVCLGYGDQHFRELTSNRNITSLQDLSGLKIRTMQNPNHIRYWSLLGANPTPMVWGEVYLGLQQNSIDAQENPYESIVASKVYEQQKYIIETHHILHTVSLIMNQSTYDKLSEEEKVWVKEAAKAAIVYSRKKADERIENRKEIIRNYGIEILEVNTSFKEDMNRISKEANQFIEQKIEKDLVQELYKAIEREKND